MNKRTAIKAGAVLLVLAGSGYAFSGFVTDTPRQETSSGSSSSAMDHSGMERMVTYVKPKTYIGTKAAITSYLGEIQTEKNGQIYAYRGGIVEAYLANVGDTVKKGQVVARLLPAEYSPDIANMIADRKAERTRSEGMVRSAELALEAAKSRREQIQTAVASKVESTDALIRATTERRDTIDAATRDRIASNADVLWVSRDILSRTKETTALQLEKTDAEQDAAISKFRADLAALDTKISTQETEIENMKGKTATSIALESDKLALREATLKTAIKNAYTVVFRMFYGDTALTTPLPAQLKRPNFGVINSSAANDFVLTASSLHPRFPKIDLLSAEETLALARDVIAVIDKGLRVLDATTTSSEYGEDMLNADRTMLLETKTNSMNGLLTTLNMYEEQKSMLAKETNASSSELASETLMLEKMRAERTVLEKELAMAEAQKDRMLSEVENMKSDSENEAAKMVAEAENASATERADRTMALSEVDRMIQEARKMRESEKAEAILSVAEADKMVTEAEKALIEARSSLRAADEALGVLESAGFSNEVRAPFDGKITRRYVNAGESVAMSAPFYDIVGIWAKREEPKTFVRFEIPETDLLDAAIDKEVRFYRTAEPLRKLPAKIVRLSPAVWSATRWIVVEAEYASGDENLPIGSSVRVEMEKAGNMLLVPVASVVQSDDGKLRVFTVDPEGIVRSKEIATERTVGLDVYVSSGLAKDDRVVELPKNYAFLEDGIKVSPMEKPTVSAPAGAGLSMPEGHKH